MKKIKLPLKREKEEQLINYIAATSSEVKPNWGKVVNTIRVINGKTVIHQEKIIGTK